MRFETKRPADWEDKVLAGEVAHDAFDVRVRFVNLDEGYAGDFDAEDAEDVPLLRLDVRDELEARAEGLGDDDGWESYCTLVPAWTPREQLERLAALVAQDIHYWRSQGVSAASRIEELSWMGSGKVVVGGALDNAEEA